MDSANLVDWARPDVKAVYEKMIAVLISRLNPAARRIDGAGGDGGRDVQVKLGARLEIYELKSFHGRLSEGGRKAQISRSLQKAATHNPAVWYLIAPIDLTPEEEEWFEELTGHYPFPCHWPGELWLNNHMALFPDIRRYFLIQTSHEVVTLLRELNAEKAAFNDGLVDAIDRLRTLTARFNADDPFYAFSFACDPDGSVTTSVKPRYIGAEQDCPIEITTHVEFPSTNAGQEAAAALEATFAYGSASEIPSEYVTQVIVQGPQTLAGTFDSSALRIGPSVIENIEQLRLRAQITSPDGAILANLPMAARAGTRGERGVVIHLSDSTGALTLDLKVDVTGGHMQVHYAYAFMKHVLPAALVPVTRFLEHLCTPNRLQIFDRRVPLGPPIAVPNASNQSADAAARLVAALTDIQQKTGFYFAIPESFTSAELDDIGMVHALTSRTSIAGTWSRYGALRFSR
jgi:hypothetical protein